MSATTTQLTDLAVLEVIANHYWEHFDGPSTLELADALIEKFGSTKPLTKLVESGWMDIKPVGSERRVYVRLPDARRIWVDDYANVTEFGRFLASEQVWTGEELQRYYEKPHKWHDEYAAYLVKTGGVTEL